MVTHGSIFSLYLCEYCHKTCCLLRVVLLDYRHRSGTNLVHVIYVTGLIFSDYFITFCQINRPSVMYLQVLYWIQSFRCLEKLCFFVVIICVVVVYMLVCFCLKSFRRKKSVHARLFNFTFSSFAAVYGCVFLLPSLPLSKQRRFCDARCHAVCVSAALVSAAKVMHWIQCCVVIF